MLHLRHLLPRERRVGDRVDLSDLHASRDDYRVAVLMVSHVFLDHIGRTQHFPIQEQKDRPGSQSDPEVSNSRSAYRLIQADKLK
ncbi:hypothetical protein D3C81_1934000 [compost metagenome]